MNAPGFAQGQDEHCWSRLILIIILQFMSGSEAEGNKTKEIISKFREEYFISFVCSPKTRNQVRI